MSESDSFIQEVTEEVRQDRMFALWKKWGPLAIAGIALIVGAAALWSWMIAQERAEAEARGGAFIQAEPTELDQQLALPDQVDGPAQLIAEMSAAAALAADGQGAAAGERYRAIAGRAGITPEYADLALLQAIRAEAANGEAGALIAELDPLAADGAPYRLLATELRAILNLKRGETGAAHADLQAILDDPGATDGLRLRANEMLSISGGGT